MSTQFNQQTDSWFTNIAPMLQELPDTLFNSVVNHPLGKLEDRLNSIVHIRKALITGNCPDQNGLTWPDATVAQFLCKWFEESKLPKWCRGSEELVDKLILEILDNLKERNTIFFEKIKYCINKLSIFPNLKLFILNNCLLFLFNETLKEADIECLNKLTSKWEDNIKIWIEIEQVFGNLGLALGWDYDLSKGVFQSTGWKNMKKLSDLLKRTKEIQELIAGIGRLRMQEENEVNGSVGQLLEKMQRSTEEMQMAKTPLIPHEARGIERSNEIVRMLPSEAAMLRHNVLKRLWHIRRAERTLLTYRVEGTEWESKSVKNLEQNSSDKRIFRGPIIACLDTSGSMKGEPETVAKAVVLEAACVARKENRKFLLFSFSGPQECDCHELNFSLDGVNQLLNFLEMSFYGGTDVDLPFKYAVEQLNENEWQRADILLVSDGLFSISDTTMKIVNRAKSEMGLRVIGLLVNRSDNDEMRKICSYFSKFNEWNEVILLE